VELGDDQRQDDADDAEVVAVPSMSERSTADRGFLLRITSSTAFGSRQPTAIEAERRARDSARDGFASAVSK
jgi:hypothetical protein